MEERDQGLSTRLALFAAYQVLRALPRTQISRAMGALSETPLPGPLSRVVSGAYCRVYGVDLSEALPQIGPYRSFDAFFTRELKPNARVISQDDLVSPADGTLSAVGSIDQDCRILVKRHAYEVGELIFDPVESDRYRGGQFAVIYLSPRDYHRVHAPVEGAISDVRGIPGDLYPVNAIGERHVPRLFVENSRVTIAIETEGLGRVMVVMVSAVIVGRVSVSGLPHRAVPAGQHHLTPPQPVRKGDGIGIFHLGSTVVLLLEPGVTISRRIGPVRYGESLLKAL